MLPRLVVQPMLWSSLQAFKLITVNLSTTRRSCNWNDASQVPVIVGPEMPTDTYRWLRKSLPISVCSWTTASTIDLLLNVQFVCSACLNLCKDHWSDLFCSLLYRRWSYLLTIPSCWVWVLDRYPFLHQNYKNNLDPIRQNPHLWSHLPIRIAYRRLHHSPPWGEIESCRRMLIHSLHKLQSERAQWGNVRMVGLANHVLEVLRISQA